MKNGPLSIFALCLLGILGGCAATTPAPSSPGAGAPGETGTLKDPLLQRGSVPDPFNLLVEGLRDEARDLEESGSPRQALEKWTVVAAFNPQDDEAARRVNDLGDRLKASADRHFHQGVNFLDGGKVKKARRELLLALADYPGHGEALDLLKNGLAPDTRPHRVEEGETLETIASRAYDDPGAAVLIARLNELSPGGEVEPGRILQLPLFEGAALKGTGTAAGGSPASDGKPTAESLAEETEAYIEETGPPPEGKEVAMVREYLEEGSYKKAIDTAGSIPSGGLTDEGLRELLDASYYGLGRKQQREKRYREALESLGKVDPGYRDVRKVVAAVEKAMRREAEEHYIAGVRYFVDQKLEQAIVQWEETLALNPDHSKASKDLNKARRLMEELERIR